MRLSAKTLAFLFGAGKQDKRYLRCAQLSLQSFPLGNFLLFEMQVQLLSKHKK